MVFSNKITSPFPHAVIKILDKNIIKLEFLGTLLKLRAVTSSGGRSVGRRMLVSCRHSMFLKKRHDSLDLLCTEQGS